MADPLLAGNSTQGSIAPVNLFGGESKVTTSAGMFRAAQVLARYTVIARAANGEIVAWDPASADAGIKVALGVSALSIDTTGGALSCPFYDGGTFNHQALVWPAAVTTLIARKQAFDRTPVHVEQLL